MNLAALRWLLPTPLYDAAGLRQSIEDAAAVRPPCTAPDWPQSDGPAARRLGVLVEPLLPPGSARRGGADYGDPPNVAAFVRYRGRDGGYVRIMRRRLVRPLLLEAFVDAARGDVVGIRPTGTEVVHCDDDDSDRHRLVVLRPNGTLWIIDSNGLPTAGTAAPLSRDQLETLTSALDRADADVGGEASPYEGPAPA
jgi:hypothetical protein